MLDVVQIPLGAYRTNCYLVARAGASEAAVIDPGDDPEAVRGVLAERGLTAAAVLVTHGHFDHLGAVRGVAESSGVDVWMPRGEADDLRTLAGASYEADHLLDGGETVTVAKPPALHLRTVELASYIKAKPIIVRRNYNEIEYREYAHWGEPLELGIGSFLSALHQRGVADHVSGQDRR